MLNLIRVSFIFSELRNIFQTLFDLTTVDSQAQLDCFGFSKYSCTFS